MSTRASGSLLALGCIWGASFLFVEVAIEGGASPLQLALIRTLTGAIVLNVFVVLRRRPRYLSRPSFGAVALLSLLGAVLPFLAITWAQQRIDSGPAAVLNATMPIFTALFAAAFLPDERLTLRALGALSLGVVGVAVLTGGEVFQLRHSNAAAQLAVVAASASYGAAAVLARVLVRRYDAVSLSAANLRIAAVVLFLLTAAFDRPYPDVTAAAWASILALGLLGTGVAYVLYYWLIEEVGSVRSSLVTYIIPVVAVALGAGLLHEPLPWNTFAGGAIIALGVGAGTGGAERLLALFVRVRPPVHARAAVDAPKTGE